MRSTVRPAEISITLGQVMIEVNDRTKRRPVLVLKSDEEHGLKSRLEQRYRHIRGIAKVVEGTIMPYSSPNR